MFYNCITVHGEKKHKTPHYISFHWRSQVRHIF